jgi:zinc protease
MIGKFLVACSIAIAVSLPAVSQAAPAANPRTMTFAPLEFRVPKAERFVLDNGMIVYLIEDRELPLVNVTAYVRTGSIYEPAEKTGLAALTGAVMRSGGIAGIAGIAGIEPEKLDAELEFMVSSVESSIGSDVGNVSMATLSRNLDRTLELFAGVLRAPSFREERFTRAVNMALEGLRRQNDDPKDLAGRELHKALYAGHPLGRYPTPTNVKAVTRDDLVAFHRTYYRPNNVILAVSGDIGRSDLREKLTKVFGDWKREDVTFPAIPQPEFATKPGVLLVKKELNQSAIRMGHEGIEKSNPDLYAIRVMDFILGGNGFNSRMMAEVRTRQGLAYNVDSYFDIGRRFPGLFLAETETKSGTTAKAIRVMLDIMKGMTKEPVSEQELTLAKESMINSFIFGFAKADSVVNQRVRLEYYGYHEGYLENYRDNIAKVSREDVLRVAKKYLHPESLTIVVAGDEKSFDGPLGEFGKVREVKPENGF